MAVKFIFCCTFSSLLFFFYLIPESRWHLSSKDVDDVAVYIPMSKINDEGANFITILKAIPPEELLRKQEAVRRIGKLSFGFSIINFSLSFYIGFSVFNIFVILHSYLSTDII